VAAEIALALVLLVGASLLGETLFRVTAQPLGFNPSGLGIVSFRMTRLPGVPAKGISSEEYRSLTPAQKMDRVRIVDGLRSTGWWLHMSTAIDRLAALPGVVAVGGGYTAPLAGSGFTARLRPVGAPEGDAVIVRLEIVTERYFEAMEMPILRGRNFSPGDRQAVSRLTREQPGPSFAIVSRELERRLFGGEAVGKRAILGTGGPIRLLEVIGVVPDVRWRKHAGEDLATFYLIGQEYHSINALIVRAAGDAAAVLPEVRKALGSYDPNIVVTATAAMDDILATSVAEERFRATLSALFGGAALLLAAVGVYGLAARRVTERRREIGVRVAFGARPGDIRRLVLRDALRTVCLGLVLGLPGAFAVSRTTQSFLFGVSPAAPHIFLSAGFVLAAATILATLLPARRAGSIDPMLALRD
jgi:hypothetical protein